MQIAPCAFIAALAVLILPGARGGALADPGQTLETRKETTDSEHSRGFAARDIFALTRAEDIQISSDSRRVLFVRAAADIMTDSTIRTIWSVEAATGASRQVVDGSASSPRWSSDGGLIAYLAPDKTGASQVFVRPLGSGADAKQVTHGAQSPGSIAWSPDGRYIAFTCLVSETAQPLESAHLSKPVGAVWAAAPTVTTAVHYQSDSSGFLQPGYTQAFVVAVSGGAARQLTSGPFDVRGPLAWTPDGRALLFSANREPGRAGDLSFNSAIFAVDLVDNRLTQLTHRLGSNSDPAVSPDGRLIAYTGFDFDNLDYDETHLYVMNRDGSDAHQVDVGLDRDIREVKWGPDSQSLYLSYGDHGEVTIARSTLRGDLTVLDRHGAGSNFSVSNRGDIALALGAVDRPADVFVISASEKRRLTGLNDRLLRGKTLGAVHPLPVRSSFDGEPIAAWMVTPPDFNPRRRYPTILWIHGGPYGSEGPQWITDFQLFAAAGYVVVYANPRGSTSYGFDFAHQLTPAVPGHDYDDLMSAVDAAVETGVADPRRLFVMGGSYGGLMTAWIVSHTHRFKAAVAEKPIINFTSEALATDQYAAAKLEAGALPWENASLVWKESPLAWVGQVETPTMLIVGDDDRRTPVTEAEQFYDALQLRGVPTALAVFPGAGHETLASRPSQHIEEDEITLSWFARDAR